MDRDTIAAMARELATGAGQLALDMQKTLTRVRSKGPKDLVTEADEACEGMIVEAIRRLFPDHSIVTEEAPARQTGSDVTWYVDPIDGTVNYSRGIPIWGVSIAVAWRGRIEIGVIRVPALGDTYTALLGKGAARNGTAIRVSTNSSLADCIMSSGDFNVGPTPERRDLTNRMNLSMFASVVPAIQRIKCFGSAVVESAMVATGALDAYLMNSYNPWDVAAASLLVTEAGGRVTDIDGRPFALDGVTALFTNGAVHEKLREALTAGSGHAD